MPSYTKVISPNGGEIEIISIAISEGKNTYRVTLTTEDNKNLGYIIYTIDNAHVYLHDLRKTTTENYLNVEVALLERMQVKSFVYAKGRIETYFMSPLLFSLGLRYKPKYEWQFAHGRKQNLQTLGSNYKTAKSENEKNNLKQSILKLLKELSIQEAVKTQVRENLGLSDTADITEDQMVEHGLFFNLNQPISHRNGES